MDHAGEVPRLTTAESTDLGMAGVVQTGETYGSTGTSAEFARHVRAAASGGAVPVAVFHREPGPGPAVAYAKIGASGGAAMPVGHLPGGGAAYDDYGYCALQPRPIAGHSEALVDLLPNSVVGHGEVFVGLHSGGVEAVEDDYGYHQWQPRHDDGRGEVFIGQLPDRVCAVFVNSGNFAQQTLPNSGRTDGIAGVLRDLGAGKNDGPRALADDLGSVYDNPGMLAEQLRRLLSFAGIGACSVAVNGLAVGPGSAAGFHLFVLLLAGLFLVILHVIRV